MRTANVLAAAASLAGLALVVGGCAVADEDEASVGASDHAMTSAAKGLQASEMRVIAPPRGLPRAWPQPDSDGWFDERGKCGPTAVANLLRLYGKDGVSPDAAYDAGVRWWVGSRPPDLGGYLDRKHRDLGCRITFAPDGPALLRAAVATDRPVLAWFRTEGLSSHWVAVAGVRGPASSPTEEVVLLSWGRYYAVPMTRFAEAWDSVYGFRNPAIVCSARSPVLAASP